MTDLKNDLDDMCTQLNKEFPDKPKAKEEPQAPILTPENSWRIVTKDGAAKMGKPPNQAALKQYAEDQPRGEAGVDKSLIDEKTEKLKSDLEQESEEERRKKLEKEKKKDDEYWSSGVESDHDVDLLVEQEVLQAIRTRAILKEELRQ